MAKTYFCESCQQPVSNRMVHRCPASSPQPPTSTPTNQITPSQLFEFVGRLRASLHQTVDCLNQIGTQLSEFSQLARMANNGRTPGPLVTPATPSKKHRDVLTAVANSAQPLAPSSKASTRKGAKAARSKGRSRAPSSLAEGLKN